MTPDPRVEPDADKENGGVKSPSRRMFGLSTRLRNYFFAGVLVTMPIAVTFYLTWLFINFVDNKVTRLIPEAYNPESYLPFALPGLGLLIVFTFLTLIGALTAGFMGRLFVRTSERLLARMPVIRSVYGAIKQILETVLAQQSRAFREAVLVEYPRRGIWAVGFITGVTEGEVQNITDRKTINVFLPTTPNPTSGFLLFVPEEDMIRLSMSVEEAIKMVISGGLVTPPDRRPVEQRTVTLAFASPDRDAAPEREDVALAAYADEEPIPKAPIEHRRVEPVGGGGES